MEKQIQYLKRLFQEEKLPHALLVSGISSAEFVSKIFGQEAVKKVHPDFIFVAPVEKQIKIEQIRDCIWRMSLSPFAAPLKVAIIDQAHLLNKDAQSALLKTLEEPRGKALLVLVTDYPEALFSTILSRVQRVRFHKKSEEPEEKIMAEIAKVAKSDLAVRFHYAEKVSKDPELKEILTAWLYYLRQDLVKNKAVLQKLQNTYYLISKTNVNSRLALENLMLEL